MRKAMLAFGVLGSLTLALALAGCAAMPLPAPESEGDCLVVIRTRVENPGRVEVLRNYWFGLSTGGAEKLMPSSPSSYMAFVIDRGSTYISNFHTNVTAQGWNGSASETPIWIPLPYKPGYAMIADVEFVLSIKPKPEADDGRYYYYFDRNGKLSPGDKAALREELKKRKGIEAWRLEE